MAEVLLLAVKHAQGEHHLPVTLKLVRDIQRSIHDDGSDEHLRSQARADAAAAGTAHVVPPRWRSGRPDLPGEGHTKHPAWKESPCPGRRRSSPT
jgi:hypothetical protein